MKHSCDAATVCVGFVSTSLIPCAVDFPRELQHSLAFNSQHWATFISLVNSRLHWARTFPYMTKNSGEGSISHQRRLLFFFLFFSVGTIRQHSRWRDSAATCSVVNIGTMRLLKNDINVRISRDKYAVFLHSRQTWSCANFVISRAPRNVCAEGQNELPQIFVLVVNKICYHHFL